MKHIFKSNEVLRDRTTDANLLIRDDIIAVHDFRPVQQMKRGDEVIIKGMVLIVAHYRLHLPEDEAPHYVVHVGFRDRVRAAAEWKRRYGLPQQATPNN